MMPPEDSKGCHVWAAVSHPVRVKKMLILMLMVRVKKMLITTPWTVQDSKGCHVSHPVRVKKMLPSSTSAATCTRSVYTP
mmetsp:Transcript_15076/g.54335  ORF Transcript_15076/g.54335 Transcript_15076/m.54335 type:complete len:80 (+) Transcript_15076:846-1085(+)